MTNEKAVGSQKSDAQQAYEDNVAKRVSRGDDIRKVRENIAAINEKLAELTERAEEIVAAHNDYAGITTNLNYGMEKVTAVLLQQSDRIGNLEKALNVLLETKVLDEIRESLSTQNPESDDFENLSVTEIRKRMADDAKRERELKAKLAFKEVRTMPTDDSRIYRYALTADRSACVELMNNGSVRQKFIEDINGTRTELNDDEATILLQATFDYHPAVPLGDDPDHDPDRRMMAS